MQLPQLLLTHEFIPIPDTFFSSDGCPFEKCLVCRRYLLNEGSQYMIEKAVRGAQIQFEYAICTSCFENLAATFSEESRNRLDEYYSARIDLVRRREYLMRRHPFELDEWLSHCLITGLPREAYHEYNLVVECDGDRLLFAYSPFLISGDALEEMYEVLSEKTREELGGFMENCLGIPPESAHADRRPRFLMV